MLFVSLCGLRDHAFVYNLQQWCEIGSGLLHAEEVITLLTKSIK